MAISKKIREAVYQKYGGRCAYCGRVIAYKDMQVAKVSEVTGAPLPKPLTWKRGFYDTTRTFPSGWYECPVCGCRVDWEPEQCPKCYTRLELEETEG